MILLHAQLRAGLRAYRQRWWPRLRTALAHLEPLLLWLRSRLEQAERLPSYWALLVLLGLAGALRIAAVLAWHVDPIWDGNFYHTGAISLAEGHGYTTPEAGSPRSHYPVGYSALLAPAYWLFGNGPLVAPLFNAAVGVASTWLVWLFGRRALGPRRGFVAALLMAIHPGLILYCNLTMTEPLAGFLLLAAGYAALWLPVGGSWLSGACLGLAVLVRPQSLLALPLLLWASPGGWARRVGITLRAGTVCALMVAPWTARNCQVLDGCALVSTNGGWNLAISALTEDGGYRELPPGSACRDAQGPVEQDRCFRNQGWAWIAQNPWAWLAKIPDKLRHTYNYEAFAIGYLANADPETWPQQRAWAWIRWVGAFHHLLMFAAVLSVLARSPRSSFFQATTAPPPAPALPWAQRALLLAALGWVALSVLVEDKPVFWLLVAAPAVALLPVPGAPPPLPRYWWGLLLLTSLTHAVFFGSDRYHLVVSPLLCLLAAAALRQSTAPSPGTASPL